MFAQRWFVNRRVTTIAQHPNVNEICSITTRIMKLSPADIQVLADAWLDSHTIANARGRAQCVHTVLICEMLAISDQAGIRLECELTTNPVYADITPATFKRAKNAVLDAIAAAFAKPQLDKREYEQLMWPWRQIQSPVGHTAHIPR